MLRAWLLQLANQLQDGHQDLTRLHGSYPSCTPPSPTLLEYLRRLVQRFDHAYLVLDALDGSPRNRLREKVLDAIETIRRWGLHGVHLFVTSRDEVDIRESTNPFLDQEVRMRNAEIENDIADYISSRLTGDRRLGKWLPYRDRIQEILVMRAQGVYVYSSY